MGYNSTIRQKRGKCDECNDGIVKPLIKGKCENHYWQQVKMKSVKKMEEREFGDEESLSILFDDLDIIFSRWLRLRYSDKNGRCKCFTCDLYFHWTKIQCGHFIKRGNKSLRYDPRNCRPQCRVCNEFNGGEEKMFAQNLEIENPGIVDILKSEGREVYKYNRQELKSLIGEYYKKVTILKNNIK